METGAASQGEKTETEYVAEQNAFQRRLSQFVNGGLGGGRQALLAMAGLRKPWQTEADALSEAFERLLAMPLPTTSAVQRIAVKPYGGNAKEVLALRRFVEERLADELSLCMLHGSLATGEDVAYSDVDALVVLKDEVVRSPRRLERAGRVLSRARTLMYAYDGLQHHGWFVLTERDLRCHCEAYFPTVLFRYGAALVPAGAAVVDVASRDSRAEMLDSFRALAASVRSRTERVSRPGNLYDLKTLLSQVMLLPSMYVQVRDGEGVWKGHSFERARADFSDEAWCAVETASLIRERWPEQRRPVGPWIHGPVAQKMAKYAAPAVPPEIGRRLDESFYTGVAALLEEMESRINEVHVCDRHGPIRDEVSC